MCAFYTNHRHLCHYTALSFKVQLQDPDVTEATINLICAEELPDGTCINNIPDELYLDIDGNFPEDTKAMSE